MRQDSARARALVITSDIWAPTALPFHIGTPPPKRALINGRTCYLISAGVRSGYWMPAQSGARLC